MIILHTPVLVYSSNRVKASENLTNKKYPVIKVEIEFDIPKVTGGDPVQPV